MLNSPDLTKSVRTNTLVLAACMALSWAVVQLVVSLSAVILSGLTGRPALGGFAPSLYLASWSVASLLIGRYMDTHGRAMGLRLGFVSGIAGALLVYQGTRMESVAPFLLGLVMIGVCNGSINLARAGAADMYPPARRARGISFVLLGAAFGAILSPIAFAPLLRDANGPAAELGTPWLVAMGILAAGLAVTFIIRTDPIHIGRRLAAMAQAGGTAATEPSRPLVRLVRAPFVLPALGAAIVSQGVMAALMSVTGLIMVDHGHDLASVALVMSAHFLGMFGLVLVAGQLVDRMGRQRSIVLGLVVLAGGVVTLAAGTGMGTMLPALFIIGLGWNIAFVGSTAVLADAARPAERGRLLGFNDFAAVNAGAVGAVACAFILGVGGLMPLVVAGALLSLLPIAGMLPHRPKAAQPAP